MWSYVVWKNIWIFQEKRGYINYKDSDGVPPNSLTGLLPLYISRLKTLERGVSESRQTLWKSLYPRTHVIMVLVP